METVIRTTRTLKVTNVRVTPEQERELAGLFKSSYWPTLLDVMERSCIELDTALINVSVGSPEEILGAHAVTKAAWLFFQHVQKQVYSAYQRHTEMSEEAPKVSLDDMTQGMEGMPMSQESEEHGA